MRSVLVTGCSGGIGAAICKKFKDAGWIVIGVDIVPPLNHEFIDQFFKVDLSVEQELDDLSKKIEKLDCLVNCAAFQLCKTLLETSKEEFNRVLNCNLVAPFLLSKLLFEQLVRGAGGSIINIGSIHGSQTSDGIAAYAVSKAGLAGLTRSMAIEFAPAGIRVNTISPGAIDTPMLRAHIDDIDSLGKKHPSGRVGCPDEVGELALFLADSERSGNITGANMAIDGGASIKLSTE